MSINSMPVNVMGLHERWAWEAGEEEVEYEVVECKYCGEIYGEDDATDDEDFPCPYCEVDENE